MLKKLLSRCIDINSPHCPCLLAETNHCVFCSHLKGEAVCNCNWNGTCILYERQWQTKRENYTDTPIRSEVEAEFTTMEEIAPEIYWLTFDVTPDLAEDLKRAGSFVFLRRPDDPDFSHFPVGVMKVNGTNIEVVVEAAGPKSARIVADGNKKVLVRGPYFNGVFGQPWITEIHSGKVLLVSGGMGQPPALPLVHQLAQNNNDITAVLAPGKVGTVFIEKELKQLGVKVYIVPSLRQIGMQKIQEWFSIPDRRPDLVVSAGPDEQHQGVIAAMHNANVNIPMAATNNATMCCGEGICGSCLKKDRNNQWIRTCKVQTDFTELLPDYN